MGGCACKGSITNTENIVRLNNNEIIDNLINNNPQNVNNQNENQPVENQVGI